MSVTAAPGDGIHGRGVRRQRHGVDRGDCNVSVFVCVMDESDVLVAVTVNDNCVPGQGRLSRVRQEVDADDSRFAGRNRDARAAVGDRKAAGHVRKRQVVGVGSRTQVLDRGGEGRGQICAVEGHSDLGIGAQC